MSIEKLRKLAQAIGDEAEKDPTGPIGRMVDSFGAPDPDAIGDQTPVVKTWICDDHQGEGFDPDCESCQSRATDAWVEQEIDRRMEER